MDGYDFGQNERTLRLEQKVEDVEERVATIETDGLPPAAHDHEWNEIIGKPLSYPPDAHTHDWPSITGKPFAFMNAELSSSVAITANAWTKLAFSELRDDAGIYNPTTGTVTISVAGRYRITASVCINRTPYTNIMAELAIFRGAFPYGEYLAGYSIYNRSQELTLFFTRELDLIVGDALYLAVNQTATNAYAVSDTVARRRKNILQVSRLS